MPIPGFVRRPGEVVIGTVAGLRKVKNLPRLVRAVDGVSLNVMPGEALGIVFNPGAFTHTSIALHDAIKGVDPLPVIECHVSNVHAREAFRHHSWVSPAAAGIVVGFGVDGYLIAMDGLVRKFVNSAATKPS